MNLLPFSHTVTDTPSEMTDGDHIMNPQHFGSSPADVQIWINPEMSI